MLGTFETFSVPSEDRKWAQYLNTSENFVQVCWDKLPEYSYAANLVLRIYGSLKGCNSVVKFSVAGGRSEASWWARSQRDASSSLAPFLQQQPAALRSVSCQYKALWCGECSLSYSTGKLLHLLIRVLLDKQVGLTAPERRKFSAYPWLKKTTLCLWSPSSQISEMPALTPFWRWRYWRKLTNCSRSPRC